MHQARSVRGTVASALARAFSSVRNRRREPSCLARTSRDGGGCSFAPRPRLWHSFSRGRAVREKEPSSCRRGPSRIETPATAGCTEAGRKGDEAVREDDYGDTQKNISFRNCASVRTGAPKGARETVTRRRLLESSFVVLPRGRLPSRGTRATLTPDPRCAPSARADETRLARTRRSAAPTATTGATTTSSGAGRRPWARRQAARARRSKKGKRDAAPRGGSPRRRAGCGEVGRRRPDRAPGGNDREGVKTAYKRGGPGKRAASGQRYVMT